MQTKLIDESSTWTLQNLYLIKNKKFVFFKNKKNIEQKNLYFWIFLVKNYQL